MLFNGDGTHRRSVVWRIAMAAGFAGSVRRPPKLNIQTTPSDDCTLRTESFRTRSDYSRWHSNVIGGPAT
jgi:hypothetical protein